MYLSLSLSPVAVPSLSFILNLFNSLLYFHPPSLFFSSLSFSLLLSLSFILPLLPSVLFSLSFSLFYSHPPSLSFILTLLSSMYSFILFLSVSICPYLHHSNFQQASDILRLSPSRPYLVLPILPVIDSKETTTRA